MTIDEVMKLWRMADKKFRDSDKQPADYRNLARRLVKLAKHAPDRLAVQWLRQSVTYYHIADTVEKLHN